MAYKYDITNILVINQNIVFYCQKVCVVILKTKEGDYTIKTKYDITNILIINQNSFLVLQLVLYTVFQNL
jgi:hypothetical protein